MGKVLPENEQLYLQSYSCYCVPFTTAFKRLLASLWLAACSYANNASLVNTFLSDLVWQTC
jgi:hypothetical protein